MAFKKISEQENSDLYKQKALEEAQPEVKDAIERFYSEEDPEEKVLMYWLFGKGTPDFKMPKEYAQYTDESEEEGQTCGNCEFRYLKEANGKLVCSQVGKGLDGGDAIERAGWCKLWKKEGE